MRTSLIAALIALACTGCFGLEPLAVIGDQCDINSDCQAPLVCALGRCRNECEVSRDCALGLRCIQLQVDLGVCQLPDEANCTLDSDCPETLVCFDPGGCLLRCVTDDDCAAGETCTDGECLEPEVLLCIYPSDCAYPQICDTHQRCARECTTSVDCGTGDECVPHPLCNGPCMCRRDCSLDPSVCLPGTECVACDAADCGAVTNYCERPATP